MLDIHTHLFWKSYDADRDAVVARAREAGVTKMICVGTEPEDNPLAIEVAEKYEGIYVSVGLHPHFFNESRISNLESWGDELRKLTKHPKVVAIGECGLDYFSRDPEKPTTVEQKEWQKEGFLSQLELARELGLPLIIHTRPSAGSIDAYEDVYSILKSKIINLKSAVLHCYQGDTEVTKKFLELENVYFSFAGNITYPVKKVLAGTKPARIDTPARSRYSVSGGRSVSGRDGLSETVRLVPLERLFVETDCPFLAPQSKRGQRNEPAFVAETGEFLASLKGISRDALGKKVTENGNRVFWRSC